MPEIGYSRRFISTKRRYEEDFKLPNKRRLEFYRNWTPVSQIDKLERQNPNRAINVFGWDKEQVLVHKDQ